MSNPYRVTLPVLPGRTVLCPQCRGWGSCWWCEGQGLVMEIATGVYLTLREWGRRDAQTTAAAERQGG